MQIHSFSSNVQLDEEGSGHWGLHCYLKPKNDDKDDACRVTTEEILTWLHTRDFTQYLEQITTVKNGQQKLK